MSVAELYGRVRDAGQRLLDRAAALCAARNVAVECKLYVGLGGRPAEMILKEARSSRADLIVMGTHGRTGLGRLAFGSNAEHVVRNADVPVLLVRAR
jgi:nucleotide-binding universal stress UspA family protein